MVDPLEKTKDTKAKRKRKRKRMKLNAMDITTMRIKRRNDEL